MRLIINCTAVLFVCAASLTRVSEAVPTVTRQARDISELHIPVAIISDKEVADDARNIATISEEQDKKTFVRNEVPLQDLKDEALNRETINEAITESVDLKKIISTESVDVVKSEGDEMIENREPELVVQTAKDEKKDIIQEEEIEEKIKLVSDVKSSEQKEEKQEENKDKLLNEKPLESVVEKEKEKQEEAGVLRQGVADSNPTTTQANFVQQLIQNSPLGPLFNQFSGQNVNDAQTTASPLQPFLNPIQSVVNQTSQAFQGFQQFASSLGTQFQNTFGGQPQQQQQQQDDVSTSRPGGPLQQFVSNFIGGGQNQPSDPPQQQQGPLQTLFTTIFQGGQRPAQANPNVELSTTSASAVSVEPQIEEGADNKEPDPQIAIDNNQLRGSDDADDSFEQNVKAEEQIIVNDDETETDKQTSQTAVNAIA